MKSIREIYKIGKGPSSSHTMGPERAAKLFKKDYPQADAYKVILFGSLSKTGIGHGTDAVIKEVLSPTPTEIVFSEEELVGYHPNTMDIIAYDEEGEMARRRFYSIGGGEIIADGELPDKHSEVYDLNSFTDISRYCREREMRIWQYVEEREGAQIWEYLEQVWDVMQQAVKDGLEAEGILHGGLGIQRKAGLYLLKSRSYSASVASKAKIYAYALATSEENASGTTIVTAPTCGASGVLPTRGALPPVAIARKQRGTHIACTCHSGPIW